MLFAIAWRNIWRNKVRSIIIILSVAFGLLSGLGVMALYKGMLQSRVRTVIEAETGHIQIHWPGFIKDFEPSIVLPKSEELLKQVRSIPHVAVASPRSITQGMLATTTGSTGIQINGIIPSEEYKASKLEMKIMGGKGFTKEGRNEIMIGKKLADKMKLAVGSKLVLTFSDTGENIVAGAFRIVAIYHSDNATLDEKNAYIRMADLNNMLGIGPSFHEICIILDHDEYLDNVLANLKTRFPSYQSESWKDISPETKLMVNTVDQYSFIILAIIMLALAFGIINTMLMAVLERTREIGMMLALGMNRTKLFILIMLETIFLALAGFPVGLLSGWLLTSYFNKNGLDLSGFGKEMLSSFGYSTMIYPEFPYDKIFGVLIIVSSTAILSCLIPAIKALRLVPVEALRR